MLYIKECLLSNLVPSNPKKELNIKEFGRIFSEFSYHVSGTFRNFRFKTLFSNIKYSQCYVKNKTQRERDGSRKKSGGAGDEVIFKNILLIIRNIPFFQGG